MTLRNRVTRAAGFAVLVTVVAVSVAVYVIERSNLRDQIDTSLRHMAPAFGSVDRHGPPTDSPTVPKGLPVAHEGFRQVVDRDGDILTMFGDRPLQVTDEVLAVARGERVETFFDADVDGTPVRVHVTSARQDRQRRCRSADR
ncbi:MAG: hypothetical protein GEV00_22715 [Actinophytocola sp.]|nr:hypothetical protein [Actinophytocola sp.]